MLQLINPLWLWAIAGIIVPVLIHLWHIKTGKTLKIGSIALLGESARQSSQSFRITDWLLLLLRCLLLLLLAFLLTGPFWQKPARATKTKGWILVEKTPVKEVYQHFKPMMDSLLKAGYELHLLDTSFKAVKLAEVLKDTVRQSKQNPVAYWPLLKLSEQKVPQKTKVYLFTSSLLQHFQGKRPASNQTLHWQTYTPADSVSIWIQSAFLTSADSIRIILGNSKPNGTSFSTINLQSADRGNSRFQVSFEAGKPMVSLKNNPQKAVLVDTSTLKITVYQNQFSADAAYLEAALQAVKKFSNRKMKIVFASNFNQIQIKQNWIFWLSNQIPPKTLPEKLNLSGNIFKYENGKAQTISSWINAEQNFTENEPEPIGLYQHFLADKRSMTDAEKVWQDGFGNPVLSLNPTGKANIYHFYSHFDPAWNDLVWSSSFPKIMLDLIYKSYPQPDFSNYDKRIISPNQLQPSAENPTETVFKNTKNFETTDWKHSIWIALFFVFLLERILSSQAKKQAIYG
ncbi:MAG: BatA domain-containing protein [Janthinobacterium lividum]